MSIVIASCLERFVAMRTLFFVAIALDLLALMLGEFVSAQSTLTRKIVLALIAFVPFLFMNILNVCSQIDLSPKLFLTTQTNKSHRFVFSVLFSNSQTRLISLQNL